MSNGKSPSDRCPQCGTQAAGVQVRGQYDGVLYWACPVDYTRFHRFPQGHPLHIKATRFVEMNK